MKSKGLLFIIMGFLGLLVVFFVWQNNNSFPAESFIDCLKEEGVIIYGSTTCSACKRLEEEYGGYDTIKPIYLDCSVFGTEEELTRCKEDKQAGYVPEIQIKGELFKEWGSPENLAEVTGCILR